MQALSDENFSLMLSLLFWCIISLAGHHIFALFCIVFLTLYPLFLGYHLLMRGKTIDISPSTSSNHLEVFCYEGEVKRITTLFRSAEVRLCVVLYNKPKNLSVTLQFWISPCKYILFLKETSRDIKELFLIHSLNFRFYFSEKI